MNKLSGETSPYLLQHRHNPVHWWPWCIEAWQKARDEGKLVLVSIGYSACHWCHVMEREVFEDEECAALMNRHLVCIKVDREERPDVDQHYMMAVQLMSRHGGWPLNCFCLPDGRPVYGGTYFPRNQWLGIIDNLVALQRDEMQKLLDYAHQLQAAMQQLAAPPESPMSFTFDKEQSVEMLGWMNQLVQQWSAAWDHQWGGTGRAPKFPMPANWQWLLHYGHVLAHDQATGFVHFTLEQLALRGLYDHLGGGFYRYSVDAQWKVPHFEKMLYDNAQLLSLFAAAQQHRPCALYAHVIRQSMSFVQREWLSPQGLFYSSLDADTEGHEGRYYTWTMNELQEALGNDMKQAQELFNLDKEGYWENEQYVLLRKTSERQKDVEHIIRQLFEYRQKRAAPALDHKCIAVWNGLMISACCHAAMVLDEPSYTELATRAGKALTQYLTKPDGSMWRVFTSGVQSVDAFMDDYAFCTGAFIDLYRCTLDEQWLHRAAALCRQAIDHCFDASTGFFWYTTQEQSDVPVRQAEVEDNVIPSSNAQMARVLHQLGVMLDNRDWQEMSLRMTMAMKSRIAHPSSAALWLQVMLRQYGPSYEVSLCGPEAAAWNREAGRHYLPQVIMCASTNQSSLPLLRDKSFAASAAYVCSRGTCMPPVHSIQEAISLVT